jgi:hypothetical protein
MNANHPHTALHANTASHAATGRRVDITSVSTAMPVHLIRDVA